jgi:hypothetical protein
VTDLLPLVPIVYGIPPIVWCGPAVARRAVAAGFLVEPSALHPGETVEAYLDRIDAAYRR